MNFIYNLYQSDNFVLILSIVLVVLIVLFVIVFFWGKKDQKLEETKRLEKLKVDDTFKEEKSEPVKVESKINEVTVEPQVKEEIKKEEMPKEEVTVTEFEPEVKEKSQEDTHEEPKKENVSLFSDNKEDLKVDDNSDIFEGLKIVQEELAKVDIPEETKIEVPVETHVEEEPKVFKPSEVFSSVYVKKEDEPTAPLVEKEESVLPEGAKVIEKEDRVEIENPTVEEPKEENNSSMSKLFMIEDEDEDMELPTLKHEEPVKIENESYDIK